MSFLTSKLRPGRLPFSPGSESWVWLKETPELLAPMVSRRCAIATFPNIERVDDRTVHDAVHAGDTRQVAADLYQRLRDEQLDYAGAAYLDDGWHSQQIRSPTAIKTEQRATCLDLSLLYAALALDLGLQPIIILLAEKEHHALVVLRTTSTTTFDRHTKAKTVLDQVERGQLLAVEVTGATKGKGLDLDFDEAEELGRRRVTQWDFVAAVDPERLHRQRGFRSYTCREEPERPWALIAVVVALGMVLAAWLSGMFGSDGPIRFADTTTGVALLPAVQDDTTNELTELFDERLVAALAEGEGDGPLGNYPLATGLGGRALTEPPRPARDDAVEAVIADTNASVVLSPVIRWEGNRMSVEVDAWVGNLDGAEELAGEDLGFLFCATRSEIRMVKLDQDSPALLDDLADQMVTTQLTRIVDLLDVVADQRRFDYPNALDGLNRVLDATAGDDCRSGAEAALLHHLRGNTQLDLGNYRAATADYNNALELDPEFVRSHLGLAESSLLDAVGRGCRPETANVIRSAAQQYQAISADLDPTRDIVLSVKTDVGLARALACSARAEAGLGRDPAKTFVASLELLDDALADFEALKETGDATAGLLTETAAIGYLERADVRLRRHQAETDGDLEAVRAQIKDDHDRAAGSTIRPWVEAAIAFRSVEVCEAFGADCDSERVSACDLNAESADVLAGSESAALEPLAAQADELGCGTG